jgi:2-polyprenyl-6-methoxyphenol hydroxylase-like FAD-dependent oxidoreductase
MSANVPIAIIGAGISGPDLAQGLIRRGILTTIYEKSPPPTTKRRHNYGITLSPDSCTPLSLSL